MQHQATSSDPLRLKSRDEAEAVTGLVVSCTLQLNEAITNQNAELLEARRFDDDIKQLKANIERYAEALEDWSNRNRKAEFGESQTLELRHGVLKFRKKPRCVELLKGWTEDLVLAKMRKIARWKPYIRVKESLDRQRMLADSRAEVGRIDVAQLKSIGLEIGGGETFCVEPKLEQA